MIIRRYLMSQVLATTIVVTTLLTAISIGGRLIKYFGVAAQGRLDVSVLLTLVAYRLPDFLVLILPLSFFVGLMLVFGRLYVDHEMAIFNSSGISRDRLGFLLWPLVLLIFVVEMTLTTVAAPWGNRSADVLFAEQALRSGFDLVKPGEFISSGQYTIYAGSLSDDRRELKDVFFYQRAEKPEQMDRMIVAQRASRVTDPEQKASIVDLKNGRQYQISPNGLRYNQAEFSYYRLRIEHDQTEEGSETRLETLSLSNVWKRQHEAPVRAELGWRLAMPWTIWLAAFMAIPLSQVSPRQGRYLKLFPAIVLFASLVVSIVAIKARVSKEKIDVWAYVAVLFGYLILSLLLAKRQRLAPKVRRLLGAST